MSDFFFERLVLGRESVSLFTSPATCLFFWEMEPSKGKHFPRRYDTREFTTFVAFFLRYLGDVSKGKGKGKG